MNSKRKNFIVLVEMAERELPAAALLGTELAGRGHNVWLIEKGRFRKSPASFAPSMVLEKGLTTSCLQRIPFEFDAPGTSLLSCVRRVSHTALAKIISSDGFGAKP